jgi:hypothetical protein
MSEDMIADALAHIVGANNLPKLLRSIGEKELLPYTDPFMGQYPDSDIERRYGHQLKRIYRSHAKKLRAELPKVGRAFYAKATVLDKAKEKDRRRSSKDKNRGQKNRLAAKLNGGRRDGRDQAGLPQVRK